MSEANFVSAGTVEEEEEKKETVRTALTSRRFIRQKTGACEIKRRKRKERQAANKLLHTPRKAKRSMKKYGVAKQIARGFNIAEKWRKE